MLCSGSNDVKDVDPDLLVPVYSQLARCLPVKWQSVKRSQNSHSDVPLLDKSIAPLELSENGCEPESDNKLADKL